MADEDIVNNQVLQRRFGYCEIHWLIDNFFSASCKNNWVIQSPDFNVNGIQLTKWRMYLKPKYTENKYFIQTSLERLESDSSTGDVQVKWILSYCYGGKPFSMTEGKGAFGRQTKMTISWLYDAELLEKEMINISCCIFIVRCKMIVYKIRETYGIPDDLGLKYLTQDMKIMYRMNGKFDLLLRIGGDDIRAHKAVLSVRNDVLRQEIEKQGETVEIEDLAMIKKGCASDLIAFLYTANLDYVLGTPSFSMQDLIDYFNVSELHNYYINDEITIQTNYEAHGLHLKWLIMDFDRLLNDAVEGAHTIDSPFWKIDETLNFRLRLDCKRNAENIALFGVFTTDIQLMEVHIACGIGGEQLQWNHQRWRQEEGKELGFENFVSRNEIKNFVGFGYLNIICNLIIPTSNSHRHKILSSKINSFAPRKKNYHYERLSDDLLSLFETGKYCDVTIHSKRIRFKAHRAILSYRSHVIADMLREVKDGKSISIPDIAPNIIHRVMCYIYSGVLKTPDNFMDLKSIYGASIKFCVLSLKYKCSSLLQDHLGMNNALEMLVLSNTATDWKLRYAAFKFICSNLKQLYSQGEWHAFQRANPNLYAELLHYLKMYSYKRGINIPSGDFQITDFINNFYM